jgi:hypothetical protein
VRTFDIKKLPSEILTKASGRFSSFALWALLIGVIVFRF